MYYVFQEKIVKKAIAAAICLSSEGNPCMTAPCLGFRLPICGLQMNISGLLVN